MFVKTGTPQPMEVVNNMCAICGANIASVLVDGKMICASCAEKQAK